MMRKNLLPHTAHKGFTIMELIVSVAIFAFMTAFIVAKYGNFNQGILLNSLAYDVALTLRNAQSYGLNVKSVPGAGSYTNTNYSDEFRYAYGVHFDKNANTQVIFFADNTPSTPDGRYTAGQDTFISKSTLKGGSKIQNLCVISTKNSANLPSCNDVDTLDIVFKRPDPDAIINGGVANGNKTNVHAEIILQSSDGSTKKVIVQKSGRISVSN